MTQIIELILFHAGLAGCAVSTVLVVLALPRSNRRLLMLARGLLLPSALLLAAALVLAGIREERFPVASLPEGLVFLAVVLTLGALALDLLRSMPVLTVGVAPVATIMLSWAALLGIHAGAKPDPITRGFLPAIHAIATICAFVFFALALVAALLYLLEQGRLKSRVPPPFPVLMPPLERLYGMMLANIAIGMVLLTAGILMGYLYARTAFAEQTWRMDPKILTTTLTWLAYL
ncbi:MAG: cytochrome c biogenesis protein CcsA, partial [Planctomycetota bacterium]